MSGEVTGTTGRFSERMEWRNRTMVVFFLFFVTAGETTDEDSTFITDGWGTL